MDTKELLKMETELKAAREKLADDLKVKAGVILAELKTIGYDYELTQNGKPKIGRPKKEMNAAKA